MPQKVHITAECSPLLFYTKSQELEFELPEENPTGKVQANGDPEPESLSDDDEPTTPVLRIILSNGGEVALRGRDVKVSAWRRFLKL